jgi:hypothetical protein
VAVADPKPSLVERLFTEHEAGLQTFYLTVGPYWILCPAKLGFGSGSIPPLSSERVVTAPAAFSAA